ncbi:putative Tic20 family protein [Nonlabens dokdonensis]|jgi:transcriptional regulator with XRE-family HTH domain|uniref:Transciptional regulator n=2 Tax=Nonlabens dokdonensis TaxID=328515 RepID=L7WA38_NONDD|nr:helix-turn-helix domain-containing protein [Nonlabens dokdonensis]AGC77082.1 transciptional regulator [Nonlabens dokdonensis DSW-6]PZX41042.1 putative Tic20 family protein [Nonlabens dokdonensis]
MKSIGLKIKEIRVKKGMSQEELATQSQVSLRTIQRLENDENEPRGKTLQLICETLDINIEELLDYGKREDHQFLMFFHLSVLAGIFIPIGNIILPLVLWLTKKDKIQGLQKIGARLLNFQIVWSFLSYAIPILILALNLNLGLEWLSDSVKSLVFQIIGLNSINYLIAIVLAIFNSRGKQITYPSIIPMIR